MRPWRPHFLVNADVPQGLPGMFAQTAKAPQVSELIRTVYGTDTNLLGVANIILITGFASWPLILLGTLQCAQALAQYSGNNLRPAETHDQLKMPIWFDFALGLSLLGAWVASDWPATLSAVFAAILMAHIFCWVWRLFMLFPATGMVVSGFWRGFIS